MKRLDVVLAFLALACAVYAVGFAVAGAATWTIDHHQLVPFVVAGAFVVAGFFILTFLVALLVCASAFADKGGQ